MSSTRADHGISGSLAGLRLCMVMHVGNSGGSRAWQGLLGRRPDGGIDRPPVNGCPQGIVLRTPSPLCSRRPCWSTRLETMTIRLATDQDWPSIYPFYAAIMAEGKTCARDVDYLGPGCHHLGGNIAAVFETSFSRPAWHALMNAVSSCARDKRAGRAS